jgi:hypothetical protein
VGGGSGFCAAIGDSAPAARNIDVECRQWLSFTFDAVAEADWQGSLLVDAADQSAYFAAADRGCDQARS